MNDNIIPDEDMAEIASRHMNHADPEVRSMAGYIMRDRQTKQPDLTKHQITRMMNAVREADNLHDSCVTSLKEVLLLLDRHA